MMNVRQLLLDLDMLPSTPQSRLCRCINDPNDGQLK